MKKDFWKRRNVFITGATGIIGSWLTIKLVEEGANVIALIRDWVPHSNLKWSGFQDKITIVRGDLIDYKLILRTLNEYEIETCFHLAAQTIVTIANRSPLSTYESNIRGTWNVLEAARNCPTLKQIVVASSDKTYGEQKKLPCTEEQPMNGLHPYDASKSCTDILARMYYHSYKLPVGITRFANVYGGGDLNWNRIIPGTIRSIIYNEDPIIRSDGNPLRDYIFVKDAVEAYLTLAEHLEDKKIHGNAFNFGMDNPISVMDLTKKILKIAEAKNLNPKIMSLKKIKGEIDTQYLDSTKAKKMLNWKLKYSLEEGLKETLEWYRNYFNRLPCLR